MDQDQIEQQTDTNDAATRDDLIAAVQEAASAEAAEGETRGEQALANGAADALAGALKGTEATEAPDPVAEVLRKREEMHRKRLDADAYATQLRAQAEAERQRIIDEARAEAERLRAQSTTDLRQRYKEDPTGFLRSLDDNPMNVVDEVMRQGTPEWRAMQKLQQETAEAKKLAEEGRGAKAELEKFREEQKAEKLASMRAAVQEQFLTQHASAEKAPYLHARYDAGEVFERCDALCREWQADGLKLGVDFDRDTLVAYLEKQSRERYTKLSPSQGVATGSAAQEAGPAASQGSAKKSANGTRTLSVAQGSERRTQPRPLSEMKPEEARAALIEEVKAARRANPDSEF